MHNNHKAISVFVMAHAILKTKICSFAGIDSTGALTEYLLDVVQILRLNRERFEPDLLFIPQYFG